MTISAKRNIQTCLSIIAFLLLDIENFSYKKSIDKCSLFALRYAAPKMVNQINEKRANSSVQEKDVPKIYRENT